MPMYFRTMPGHALILLAGLLVIWSPAWSQHIPGRDRSETWRATDPPDWQSEVSLTDPYPPDDQPFSSDEPDLRRGSLAEKKNLPSVAVTDQNGGTSAIDPVIQRLNEAYEDTATEGGQQINRDMATSSLGIALLRALFALALVLGLFFVFVRVLKWIRSFTPTGVTASSGPVRIAVTDRVSLGARHTVYLLRIRDRIIVAGTAPGTIVPLAVFPTDESDQQPSENKQGERRSVDASETIDQGAPARFRRLLLKTLERMEAQTADALTGTETSTERAVGDPVDRDIDALREDIERLRQFLEASGRDQRGE